MNSLHKPKVVVYNRKTCLVLNTAKSVFQLVVVEDAQVLLVAVGNGDGAVQRSLLHETDGNWVQVAQAHHKLCDALGCKEAGEVLSKVLASAGVNLKNNLETTMAAKKTAAKAASKTAAKKTKAEAPEAAKPVKTAATKAAAAKAPKVKAEKPATGEKKPRVSVSGRIRELILEGRLSDDKIFEKVQKEFNLDDKKRSYIAWNRSDMIRKGAKVPAQVGA
ncbi:hypothetical protein UFOVP435_85 [uncultured Caudovirales phage]|uniref:Uncharacterized protein n=1 Tax=uncultured Caudovirales phage TaxID=2100421 RepID=A0A6J5MHX1_9CAUD|nr:hypothetical protein UFOVP435_85 [uncultured Caudovirales phage]